MRIVFVVVFIFVCVWPALLKVILSIEAFLNFLRLFTCLNVLPQSRVAKRTVYSTIRPSVPQWLGAPNAELHGIISGARSLSTEWVCGKCSRTSSQARNKEIIHRGSLSASSIKKKIVYFWLHWVFNALFRLSLVVVSGGCPSLRYRGFSLRWLLLLWSTGFSSWGRRVQ